MTWGVGHTSCHSQGARRWHPSAAAGREPCMRNRPRAQVRRRQDRVAGAGPAHVSAGTTAAPNAPLDVGPTDLVQACCLTAGSSRRWPSPPSTWQSRGPGPPPASGRRCWSLWSAWTLW